MLPENEDSQFSDLTPDDQTSSIKGEEAAQNDLSDLIDKGTSSEHTQIGADNQVEDEFLTAQNLSKTAPPAASEKLYDRGKPWTDYYPDFTHKLPDSLKGRLEEHIDNINQYLENKELFKLRTLEIPIHRAYYGLWVSDANKAFKNAVRLKMRLSKLKKSS